MTRLVFFGGAAFAIPPLRALLGECELAVVSTPPKPAGRGLRLTPTQIAEFAVKNRLELRTPSNLNDDDDFLRWLEGRKADALVVIAYGRRLPRACLALAPAINFHGSLLPRWRGASPIVQAILHGDRRTGVTAILMNEQIDQGAIINSAAIELDDEADFPWLHARLSALTAEIIVATVRGFLDGKYESKPQPSEGVTAAARLTAADMHLDWRLDSRTLGRMVRAFAPLPGPSGGGQGGAWGEIVGIRCKVTEARPQPNFRGGVGEVSDEVSGKNIAASGIIGCGDGGLEIIRLKPQGRREMTWREFYRGRPGGLRGGGSGGQ